MVEGLRELPNSQILLAEIDRDHSLDFPIWTGYILRRKSCKIKYINID